MSRFKQLLGNRSKLLQFAPVVAALIAFFMLGVNVPSAGANANAQGADQPKNAHDYYKIRDPKVDPKMPSAQRSRIQRDASFKKRQDVKKSIQQIMSGSQPASHGGGAK